MTGSSGFSLDALVQIAGTIARVTGSSSYTLDQMLSVNGTIQRPVALYGLISGSIPRVTGVAEFTPQEVVDAIAYALNLRSGGLMPYATGYDFDFIVRFQGKSYGLNATGCYLLEGSDDNGTKIAAYLELPTNDFGSSNEKRLDSVYVGSRTGGYFDVTATADEGSSMTVRTQDSGRNNRAKMAKGLKGVNWGIKVANVAGNSMDIDNIQILPAISKRNI